MKVTFLALFLLCAAVAFGQSYSAPPSMSNTLQPVDHSQRASQQPMAREQNLLNDNGLTFAHGERPLWEVAQTKKVVPLGDIARELRKEHESAPKAEIVWEN